MDTKIPTTLIVIACLLLVIIGVGIVILVLIYQKRQLRYLREKEQLKVTFEKEILESRLEIQEQTFKNISQEIHDNIGQMLSLAKLNISTMDVADPTDVEEKKEDSRDLIGKAIQDLRDLSRSMNTDFVAEIGLLKAIGYELELLRKASSYTTHLEMEGQAVRLPAQQELILFRIFQEVLNNVIKHAKANRISVNICFRPQELLMQISDDGQGFEAASHLDDTASPNSLGIRNMQNRARMMGAGFFLKSAIGQGTTVTVHVPLTA